MQKFPGREDMDGIVKEYGDSLLRMCYLYLNDLHLAEDAVQETWIKVYKKYSQFRGDSTLKTWIVRIAVNECKNCRRGSWWKHIDASQSLESIPVSDSDMDADDHSVVLEIMKLKPKYKEVILLYYYQELKTSEISEMLKIPMGTVSVRLKRARDILKTKLERMDFNE